MPLSSDSARYQQARLARDARFDGVFFTAVHTTGIYCRPVCPAPPPRPHNVTYYPSAAAAAAAGYRPCLRCRPELSPPAIAQLEDDTLRRALRLISEGLGEALSVSALAQTCGISPRQLQRIFVARLGATAHQIHANHRLLLAKQLITETTLPMTEVALAAGFSSIRRFNAAFAENCRMPPTAIRRVHGTATTGPMRLRICYRPPLDFPAMLGFLRKRAVPGVEDIGDSRYRRVVRSAGHTVVIDITAAHNRNELVLAIHGAAAPTAIAPIVRGVRRMFDLDADLRPVHAQLAGDPLLAKGLQRRPGLRVPGAWDGFELGVRAVLGQQVSVAAATTLAGRLVTRFGQPVQSPVPELDRLFPAPETLLDAPLESIGLPGTRAASIRALARAVVQSHLQFNPGQALEEFVTRCAALPGIGPWTAHYMALRALGHPDAFPAGDLVLQKILGAGTRLTERQTEQRALAWRPWRAYAVLHLWHLAGDETEDGTR